MTLDGYVQVLTTVENMEKGVQLGRSITEARLGACVQIVGPIRSLYWWQGKVDDTQEWQLLIKTTDDRFPAPEAQHKAHNIYSHPKHIVNPINPGRPEYPIRIRQVTRRTYAPT